MKNLRFGIDENSLEKSNEIITGIIYLEFDNFIFPEKNWNDFIVVVLNNWIRSLQSIIVKSAESTELLFNDGPFFIRIGMINDKECLIECIENHRIENILFKEQVEFKILVKEVLLIANSCKLFCKKYNWHSEELHKLDILLNKISTL